ncbi:Unannotated [Lentimonas sp. CC4]|nr:Unannotated [Lentimonas sp. CC4]CAA6686347.1 Unannotated [Lentimonas sp. CC6]CAA7076122.1 Unannotated [Lentimonas sp. CC4]CAA7170885.1 Unannotated [Lentimonas sp. CC21]CAA7181173.1 Unannotated [Lentimonas sp. CC8]
MKNILNTKIQFPKLFLKTEFQNQIQFSNPLFKIKI